MATITSLGVGTNGLDTQSLVDKLVANEQVPLATLNNRTQGLQTKLSAYGQVQSSLSSLQDAARKLLDPSTWGAVAGTSTDPSSVSVSAGNGAAPGNVAMTVTRIATSQSIASTALASSSSVMGSGQITIQLGSWGSDENGASTFTDKPDHGAISIDIAPGEDTLTAIRDKVNAAGAGVTASIVTDSSGARLVLRSTETGESNGFKVSVSDASLASLAYDPSAGVTDATLTQAAGNAQATLNGLSINSESNTLTQAIDGLTITLLKPTTGTTLTVSQDTASLKTAITNFTTAYNSITSLLRNQTKYDAGTKLAGTLQGDSVAVGLGYALRNIGGGTSSLGGAFSRLADIGLNPGVDGALTINDTKLSAALANPKDLKAMFMGLDSGNAANNGFAQQLVNFTTTVLGTDGAINTRETGLQAQISQNGKSADALQAHIDQVQKRLQAQYSALDTQMSQLNGLNAYVTQQMAMLAASASNN